MPIEHAKLSDQKLQHILDSNPPDTPHFQKARDEVSRRISRRGPRLSLISLIVAVSVGITTIIANFPKVADLAKHLFK